MNAKRTLSTAVLCGAFAAAPTWAADPGFFAGISAGQAEVDNLNNVVPGIGNSDDTDTAWKIFGGYQFTPFLGVELGWNDFGEVEQGINKAEIDGISLAAVGTWPVANQFNLFGKVGAFNWNVDRDIGGDDDGTDAMVGIGAEYLFVPDVAVRAEWEWFDDVSDSEVNALTVGVTARF